MRSSLPPFIVALLVAIVVDPAIRFFERKGWPRTRSVPLLFALLLALFVGILTWGLPVLYHQAADLITNAPTYINQGQAYANHVLQAGALKRIPDSIRTPIEYQIAHSAERVTGYLPTALTRITSIFGSTVSSVLWLVITLLATYYFMLDLPKLQLAAYRAVPTRHRQQAETITAEVAAIFSAYLRGLFIVCLLNGVTIWLVLLPFKIPNSLALGVMAGTLYMVPYLGMIITIMVVGLVTFFSASMTTALIVLGILFLLHFFFDYVVTPRILGHQVGLHPLASLFAMVTAGTLFGIPGIILAVPVAASIVIILRNLYPRLLRPLPPPESLDGLSALEKPASVHTESVT